MSHGRRAKDSGRGRGHTQTARATGAALGTALVLILGTGAHAAPPTVKVTVSRDTAAPARPAPRPAAVAGPELEAEQVLSVEGLEGTVRAEQEQVLEDLISSTPDREVDEKGQYHFMLGELHAKQSRHWRLKSAELAARSDQRKDAGAKTEAKAAAEKAAKHLQKAVKSFKALTENDAFRTYPKMDTALFYYGYTLQSHGLMAEARQVLDKLIKNYPHSKYVPEAHLIFGDYFFAQGQLADAENLYRVVLKFPRSAVYWYAMYRVGWIQLRLQRFQEALESFFQVAQSTRRDKAQEPLYLASLRDFVRAYAEIGKADKASAAFQRVDPQYAPDMLQELADFYLEQGKSDRAISIYEELIRKASADQDVCPSRYNLARATAHGAGKAQEVEVCAQDVALLAEWARANGAKVACPTCPPPAKPPASR